nr:hypothetical protein [Tanacetum cinerariifolium]
MVSLKNRTGNIYDESTNTFNLTDEERELEILKNKIVKPLKSTTLHLPELCAQLFDGTMATDIKSYGTRSHEPTQIVEPHVIKNDEDIGVSGTTSQKPQSKVPCSAKNKRKRTQQMDGVETEILGVLKKNKIVKPLKSTTLHLPELCAQLFDDIGVSGTTSQKPQSKVPCSAKNKRKRTQQMDGVETEILGVLKVIADRIIEPEQPPKPEPPTLEDFQNNLKTIVWAKDDPLYEVALAIFCEPNDRYREVCPGVVYKTDTKYLASQSIIYKITNKVSKSKYAKTVHLLSLTSWPSDISSSGSHLRWKENMRGPGERRYDPPRGDQPVSFPSAWYWYDSFGIVQQ